VNEAARLSKLMFEAREAVEMYFDVTKARTGQTDRWLLRIVEEIDAYRAEHGWSPHGFGGEEQQ
jgi:hypothetical protein